jgi:hypothetical protein
MGMRHGDDDSCYLEVGWWVAAISTLKDGCQEHSFLNWACSGTRHADAVHVWKSFGITGKKVGSYCCDCNTARKEEELSNATT